MMLDEINSDKKIETDNKVPKFQIKVHGNRKQAFKQT